MVYNWLQFVYNVPIVRTHLVVVSQTLQYNHQEPLTGATSHDDLCMFRDFLKARTDKDTHVICVM